jgi:tetratricopeptide (TPR) repeat protein
MRAGDNLVAKKLLEQSASIDSHFALTHSALAESWQSLGYDGRAQASAQQALSLAKSLPENVRLKVEGQYYESQHDWAGAIPAYRHLVQDYPDDLEAGLKLAQTEISAGQLRDAAATISSLRSMDTAYRQDPRIELVEALLASRNSDFTAQQELARGAAKTAESSGSRLLLARAKMLEGWAMDDQTQLDSALQAYLTAQSIFESAGDIDNTATALDDIGIVLEKKGDLVAARERLEEAQKLFRQIGDENGLGASLTNLGELEHAQGDLASAADLYREVLAMFRKAGRKENEAAALNNLGGVLFERGEFREAKKTYENVLRYRQTVGDKGGIGYAKTNVAAALWVEGDLDESARLLNETLKTFRDVGDRGATASVETALARVLILKSDLPDARRSLSDALKVSQEIGTKADLAAVRV